jgi:hypothetical protein
VFKILGVIIVMFACDYAGTVTAEMQFEAPPSAIYGD